MIYDFLEVFEFFGWCMVYNFVVCFIFGKYNFIVFCDDLFECDLLQFGIVVNQFGCGKNGERCVYFFQDWICYFYVVLVFVIEG